MRYMQRVRERSFALYTKSPCDLQATSRLHSPLEEAFSFQLAERGCLALALLHLGAGRNRRRIDVVPPDEPPRQQDCMYLQARQRKTTCHLNIAERRIHGLEGFKVVDSRCTALRSNIQHVPGLIIGLVRHHGRCGDKLVNTFNLRTVARLNSFRVRK